MARVSLYRTYRFIDKDPLIDALRSVVQREEHLKNSDVHAVSGVATATLDNWFDGTTQRPQNATATAVTAALGYVRHDEMKADGTVVPGYKKARDIDPKEEAEKQANWLLRTAEQRARQRKKKTNGHKT